MKKPIALVLLICVPCVIWAQEGNTFNKVRYNGGSISTKVKPDDWDNKLTVSSEAIVFTLKDGQTISIPPHQVTSLSYGQEAHRRVGTAVLIGVFSLGIGALIALHKTKLHFIGVNYDDKDGKKQGLLLQGDKNNFRAMIVALQGVTGLPVSVSEKERGEIPAGITTQTAKPEEIKAAESKEPGKAAAPAASSDAAPASATSNVTAEEADAIIALVSTPAGADVNVDDAFVGNTPATLKLKPGKHTIKVSMTGYKDWARDMTVLSGSQVSLAATMEKTN